MRRAVLLFMLAMVLTLSMTASSFAAFGSSGGSSSRSSFSSGSSYKSSPSYSKPSYSSGSKPTSSSKGYSSGKPSGSSSSKPSSGSTSKPTILKPSSGPKQQPVPATKLLPASKPLSLSNSVIPRGRSYSVDRTYILGHPYYLDPYSHYYYGSPSSPYFYMYLASLNSGQHPIAPQYSSGGHHGVSVAWVLIALAGGLGLGVGGVGGYALRGSGSTSSRRSSW